MSMKTITNAAETAQMDGHNDADNERRLDLITHLRNRLNDEGFDVVTKNIDRADADGDILGNLLTGNEDFSVEIKPYESISNIYLKESFYYQNEEVGCLISSLKRYADSVNQTDNEDLKHPNIVFRLLIY